MKKTALHHIHEELGAKMVPFAGYDMPVSYAGIKAEHLAVRSSLGVFDVSHMGEFIVRGKEALDLVQWVSSNDASRLEMGDVQYSCLPNEEGGIIDDFLVYRLGEDQCSAGEQAFMLVVNASNMKKDWDWLQSQNRFDCELIDISDKTTLLAVQGPKAAEALQSLTEIALGEMKYYSFQKGKFAGLDNVLISATGYTGAGGFEIYIRNEDAEALWAAIFEAGAAYDIQPVGLGARDSLRLEMGYCLYGNDIDDTTSPIAAGLSWITKLQKGDFVGKEKIAAVKENKPTEKLYGLVMEGKRPARQGYLVYSVEGEEIGRITSGGPSPSLGKSIALAYIQSNWAKKDTEVLVEIRGKRFAAKLQRPPFWKG